MIFIELFSVVVSLDGGMSPPKNKFRADKNWSETNPSDSVSLNISYRFFENCFLESFGGSTSGIGKRPFVSGSLPLK